MNLAQPTFEQLLGSAQDAFKKGGEVSHTQYLRIANNNLRVTFLNSALQDTFLRPLRPHFVSEVLEDSFELFLFESPDLPSRKYLPFMHPKSSEVQHLCTDTSHVSLAWNETGQPVAIQILDFERQQGFYWKDQGIDVAHWDKISPLRIFFHNFLLHHEQIMLHAGAIGLEEKGIILVGKGGSGKSSTVFSCLDGPFSILSDDYLIASPDLEIFALHSTAKLYPADLERLGYATGIVDRNASKGNDKSIVYLHEIMPESFVTRLRARAILSLSIGNTSDSLISSISSHQALTPLISSTVRQIPQNVPSFCNLAKRFVESLPCYSLRLGSDVEGVKKCLADLHQRI